MNCIHFAQTVDEACKIKFAEVEGRGYLQVWWGGTVWTTFGVTVDEIVEIESHSLSDEKGRAPSASAVAEAMERDFLYREYDRFPAELTDGMTADEYVDEKFNGGSDE